MSLSRFTGVTDEDVPAASILPPNASQNELPERAFQALVSSFESIARYPDCSRAEAICAPPARWNDMDTLQPEQTERSSRLLWVVVLVSLVTTLFLATLPEKLWVFSDTAITCRWLV